VDKLSRSLRGKVGESLKSVRATLPLFDATTASFEALRKFTEGSRIAELEGNNGKAIPLLREAVTIDSTFASGWRKLAIVMTNAGRPRSSIDSAFTKAYENRHRLSDAERDYVVAGYYSSGPGRDRAKAIAAYESMLRRGDTAGPANNLALLLVSRREYARAESLYRAQERAAPGSFRSLYGNLALSLAQQGKLAEADSVIAEAAKRFPDIPLRRNSLNTRYLRGDTAGYRRAADSMRASRDSADRDWARGAVQRLDLRDGRVADWRRNFTSGRPDSATARQRLNWAINGADAWVTGEILGRKQDVARTLDAALSKIDVRVIPEVERPYFAIASTYASAGQPAKARTILSERESDVKDTALKRSQLPGRADVMGDILLAEGKPMDAVVEYRRSDRRPDGPANGCSSCTSIGLARAFDAAGNVDSAIVHYERVLSLSAFDRFGNDQFYLAPFSKRLGELHEQKGDVQKAAKYYRDFVNLWKNADPELQSQVAEVRRKLARLADIEGPRQR
jgi:tetratricopeptide (TPR) repeat protein